MKEFEEMAGLVLRRIEVERPAKWKLILSAVLKRLVIFVLVVLIVTLLTVIATGENFCYRIPLG